MINVGSADRLARIVLGLVLLVVAFVPPFAGYFAGWGPWKFLVPAVGVVMLATGLFRFCPAYVPFGISTCKRD